MNKTVNIFFSIDASYVQHFTVALTSLLENNKDVLFKIFVIHDITDIAILEKTIQFAREQYYTSLHLINIAHFDFSRFKTTDFYSRATYFRLFLADIIPTDISTGLILDSDVIITGSISELADINVEGQYIYAASEAFVDHNTERFKKIGFILNGYFNAGVMLVNLSRWRSENLTDKFLAIAEKYMDKFEWFDQDILNLFFRNNWGKFDSKYNAVHLQHKLPELPVIIHYASYSKPWYYVDTHPYNYLYWKYLKMTPFRGNRYVGFSFKNFILKNGRLVKRQMRNAGVIR